MVWRPLTMHIFNNAPVSSVNPVVPSVNVTPMEKAISPFETFAFINGYFVDEKGEFLLKPSKGIRVCVKHLGEYDNLKLLISKLVDKTTDELQEFFDKKGYKFEYVARKGNLVTALRDLNATSSEEAFKGWVGDGLSEEEVKMLWAMLSSQSTTKEYVTVVHFQGHVQVGKNRLKFFPPEESRVADKIFCPATGQPVLKEAIGIMAKFEEGRTYRFVPVSVVYEDKKLNCTEKVVLEVE
jgi:hypothetical protein